MRPPCSPCPTSLLPRSLMMTSMGSGLTEEAGVVTVSLLVTEVSLLWLCPTPASRSGGVTQEELVEEAITLEVEEVQVPICMFLGMEAVAGAWTFWWVVEVAPPRCLLALCTSSTDMITSSSTSTVITHTDTATKCSILISITVAPMLLLSTTSV